MSGKYIILEGLDLAGKSTTIKHLQQALTNKNIDSIITAHPGSTPLGQALRKLIKDPTIKAHRQTRAIMLAADNMEFQASIAKPMIDRPTWLLADRSNFISSFAYQIADGIGLDDLRSCHQVVLNPRKADHVFVFDIDYDTMVERKMQRGAELDYYERDREHFEKLRTAYRRLLDNKDDLVNYIECDDDWIPYVHYLDGRKSTEESVASILSLVL